MKTPIWTEEQILLEQYAERTALSVVRGANFTQCLTINGLAPLMTVMMPTNQWVTLHRRELCKRTQIILAQTRQKALLTD